jgi:ADP-heptose:LPS heptosyltransferase
MEKLQEIHRILLSRPDRLGDMVITTVCLSPLRKAFPDARIGMIGHSEMASLFQKHPFVDTFISLENFAELEENIKAFDADLSIHCDPNMNVAKACSNAKVPHRIGYEEDAPFLTKSYPNSKKEGTKHEAEFVFDLLSTLGVSRPEEGLQVSVTGAPLPSTLTLPEEFLVFHLGSHGNKARLPEHLFLEVLPWLWQQYQVCTVLIGSEDEKFLNKNFCEKLNDPDWLHNVCGKLNPAELLTLLGKAKGFVGRDSGPSHLAAAAGVYTFCYMPATRPDISLVRWKPLGPNVVVMGPHGTAHWWESTEKANTRVFNGIKSADLKEKLTKILK